MKKVSLGAGILIAALMISGCGAGEEAPAETAEGPVSTVPVHELVFTDSIGVELGDSNFVFGSIESVSHTEGGNILVLDRPAACVREYTPDGEFVSSIGRRGAGPGEFINPLSMTRLTDGRTAVLDQQTGGLQTFTPEGEWLGVSAEITNEPILFITPADSDRYIGTLNSWDIVDDQMIVTAVVGRFSADSEDPDMVYWENSFPFDFRDFTLLVEGTYFAMTWTSDRDGNVFLAPRSGEDYSITGFDTAGESFVEMDMDLPMVEKSTEEIALEGAFWNERARNMGANFEMDFAPSPWRWQVHSMGVDGQERLWVRRGTEETPTFDVFDYSGELLFKATLPAVTGFQGLLWEIRVDEYGILAWTLDPLDGYQKLYTLELQDD